MCTFTHVCSWTYTPYPVCLSLSLSPPPELDSQFDWHSSGWLWRLCVPRVCPRLSPFLPAPSTPSKHQGEEHSREDGCRENHHYARAWRHASQGKWILASPEYDDLFSWVMKAGLLCYNQLTIIRVPPYVVSHLHQLSRSSYRPESNNYFSDHMILSFKSYDMTSHKHYCASDSAIIIYYSFCAAALPGAIGANPLSLAGGGVCTIQEQTFSRAAYIWFRLIEYS